MINTHQVVRIMTVGTIASTVLLTGCQIGQQKLGIEEQKKFVDQVYTMVAERKDVEEVEKTINMKIKKLDTEYSSQVVRAYINALYQKNSDMISIVNQFQGELNKFKEDKKVDFSKKVDTTQLKSGLIKGLIDDVQNNHLAFRIEGDTFYVIIDTDYILEKYGQFMSDDFKKFMEFRTMEDKTPIFSSMDNSFNFEEIIKRLVAIEKEQPVWEKGEFAGEWLSSKEQYYAMIFGTSHSFFLDEKDKDKILDDIVAKYEEIISKNPDTEISKDLKPYVDALKRSDNRSNPETYTLRDELMKKKFPRIQETQQNPVGEAQQTPEDSIKK